MTNLLGRGFINSYYAKTREDDTLQEMVTAIRVALCPFKPGVVEIWLDDSLSFSLRRYIVFEVESLKGKIFKIPIDREFLIDSRYKIVLAEEAFKVVREYHYGRTISESEDHIILGEE
jgi:hypothetical protein